MIIAVILHWLLGAAVFCLAGCVIGVILWGGEKLSESWSNMKCKFKRHAAKVFEIIVVTLFVAMLVVVLVIAPYQLGREMLPLG